MRLLPVLTSAAVIIGMAAPAYADSDDNNDGAFLAALTKAGITYQSPERAIAAGKKVCDLASGGKSQLDILRDVRDLNPGFTLNGAAKFTEAAANAYCPDQLSTDSDSGNGNGGAK
jgi:hypothetical protein